MSKFNLILNPTPDCDPSPGRYRFLTDVEDFDAALYGVSPAEAAVLDPQQRLILEVNH